MNTMFSIICDIMLWLTLPIFGGLGYWEEQMSLALTDRRLIQLGLVAVIFLWAWFWYTTGETERLRNVKPVKPFFSFPAELQDGHADSSRNSRGETPFPYPLAHEKSIDVDVTRKEEYVHRA